MSGPLSVHESNIQAADHVSLLDDRESEIGKYCGLILAPTQTQTIIILG